MNEWRDTVKNPPHKWDGDPMGNILVWYSCTERAGIANMTDAMLFPNNMPFWMPLPKRPKDDV
nr:MAG TPA: Protein of unknown function (DUF551) [Caudoviricetes sp.]